MLAARSAPWALLIVLFALTGCAGSGGGDLGDSDPEAYRLVLDGKPRIVVIPLDPEAWLAYDATNGALVRAWKGGIDFAGSVYSGQHGPQPSTLGSSFIENLSDRPVWSLERGGAVEASTFRYRGYRIDHELGRVYLEFSLSTTDGREVEISQYCRALRIDENMTLLFVTQVEGLDPQEVLVLEAPGLVANEPFLVRIEAGKAAAYSMSVPLSAGKDTPTARAVPYPSTDLLLASETEAFEVATTAVLEIPSTSEAPVIDGAIDACWDRAPKRPIAKVVVGTRSDEADLSGSLRVLQDVDHLYVLVEVRDDQIVGDSASAFDDDAVEIYLDGGHERHSYYDENDAQYVFRVGDAKFWVSGNPADHPGVAFATERLDGGYRMEIKLPFANVDLSPTPGRQIGFEVHIDDDDDGGDADLAMAWHSEAKDTWSDASRMATVSLGSEVAPAATPTEDLEPGLAIRVYDVGHSLGELRRLVPGQTPNFNGNIVTIDLISPRHFGELSDNFLTEIIGYIICDQEGDYDFRLMADDGAQLFIANRPVAEVSPAAGPESEGRIHLQAGAHRLLLRHFQDSGRVFLRLMWRRPGEDRFDLVPPTAFRSDTGGVKVTSPGKKMILEPKLRLRAGDTVPLDAVHPAYSLSQARPDDLNCRVGGIDFLPDGRMLICCWDPRGDVYLIENPDAGDPREIVARRIATGLAEPLGLTVVGERIFVLQKQELTELIDHDGDDVIDEYRSIANGWGVTTNFHEFAFGLVWDGEAFWATLATAIDPGGANSQPQNQDRGRVMRIAMNGRYEFVAAGLRTPNGVGLGPDGMILVTDNQGDWLPSSKILEVRRGDFYGNRAVDPEGTRNLVDTPPIVWLPQGEIGNSPSEPTVLRDGPYAGQIVHGDVTHGGLKRTFVERVDGRAQGSVFRFMQGLEAGINRIAYGPDGGLYVGGIGSTGNWGQNGKLRYGLQRLQYNGRSVFEMLAVETGTNGLLIRFTEALAPGTGGDPVDYELHDWTYEPTRSYGGPKIDERKLEVRSATVAADMKSVFLEVPDLRAGRVVHTRLSGAVVSQTGLSPWSTEAWTTINRLPHDRVFAVGTRSPEVLNALSTEEKAEGFELLFDGQTVEHLRGWGRSDVPDGWMAENSDLTFDSARGDGGDLVLHADLGDFDFRFDWAVAPGGNSGVFYRAIEKPGSTPWESGIEYQLLDDARHADGARKLTSTGACYGLYPPTASVLRAAGRFNESRIVTRGGEVEHWLNGVKVASFTIGSADWRERFASSKFLSHENWGLAPRGALVLQDHGDRVRFRNLRLKRLD